MNYDQFSNHWYEALHTSLLRPIGTGKETLHFHSLDREWEVYAEPPGQDALPWFVTVRLTPFNLPGRGLLIQG